MPKVILFLFGLTFLFGCNQEIKESVEYKTLLKENESLKSTIDQLKVATEPSETGNLIEPSLSYDELKAIVIDIENNLAEINQEEKKIEELQNENSIEEQREELVTHILRIHDLMKMNKSKFKILNNQVSQSGKQLKDSSKKIQSLVSTVDLLKDNMNQSETSVNVLNEKVSYLTDNVNLLEEVVEEVYDQGHKFYDQANQAFILMGNNDFFIDNGIIVEEGGFMGVGAVKKINPNFDASLFSEIEIDLSEEIQLDAPINLLSSHPTNSYDVKQEGNNYTLRILDAKKFWRQSKYLLILSE